MQYFGSIWRPPSEADSLIIQATIGCSHNACLFCSMYRDKSFRIRSTAEVVADLQWARLNLPELRRIFLADGNALAMPPKDLEQILDCIQANFPECRRVSSYAAPGDLLRLTPAELVRLRERGLQLLYVGLESGSNTVLRLMNKGVDSGQLQNACLKAREAGIALSTMLISGLGGRTYSTEHADASAELVNAVQPEYLSLLSLMLPEDAPLAKMVADGRFVPLQALEILHENRRLLAGLNLQRTIFSSNHASNFLSLSGRLPGDKERMLAQIDQALYKPEILRPDYARGL